MLENIMVIGFIEYILLGYLFSFEYLGNLKSDNLVLEFLRGNQTMLVLVVVLVVVVLKSWKIVGLGRVKKKLLNNILLRMMNELFNGELDSHRITLFKEIGYFHAFWLNLRSFFYWFRRGNYKKAKLFLRKFPFGDYLKVYARSGLQYPSSFTTLMIERDTDKRKNGIASYVRFKEVSVEMVDLPDISDITDEELLNAQTLLDIKKNKRRSLKNYMSKSCIRDFQSLKRLNRRGRHFYGTIIEKSGNIWGVLSMDSEAVNNPITTVNIERFDSFAKTVGGILNIEV